MHQDVHPARFFWVTLLNALITVFEFLGGLFAGSLALLADAGHNLSDTVTIVISYGAHRLARRPGTAEQTFGYRRAEIISAFLNAGLLVVMALFIIGAALQRLFHPTPVNGEVMTGVAVISTVANLLSAALLHAGSATNLNIKATYLHVLADGLSSIGVTVTGLILMVWPVHWLDPLVSAAVALYIAYEALPIIKKTTSILMQRAPQLDYQAIIRDITALPQVNAVHHVHAWSVDEHRIIFSAHVNCDDIKLSEAEQLYQEIGALLRRKYHISHVTIQAECHRGQNERMFNIDH